MVIMDHKLFIAEFEKELQKMLDLVVRKNSDYGWWDSDAFANFKNVEKLNICSVEQWLMTRISDKVSRVGSLIKKWDIII